MPFYFNIRPAEGRVIQAECTEVPQREEKHPEPPGILKFKAKTPYLPVTQACLIMHRIKKLQASPLHFIYLPTMLILRSFKNASLNESALLKTKTKRCFCLDFILFPVDQSLFVKLSSSPAHRRTVALAMLSAQSSLEDSSSAASRSRSVSPLRSHRHDDALLIGLSTGLFDANNPKVSTAI